MFTASIKNDSLLAEFTFSSYDFKWVFRNALTFAKQTVRNHPDITSIRIMFNNDCIVVVTKSIISVLYLKSSKILDVWRYGK